jgi:TolB-like protein/cytochrome c-type biogenesis protein CcmH/NrfG
VSDTLAARGEEGAWGRLRRRKVVQWGIVYAAGAWGFLQGLAYVSSTFDWPRQFQQLTTLALLTGLPVTIVLAWYHGDRGQQRVTRVELAILTLLFLLGGGIFWRYQSVSLPSPAAVPAVALPASAATPADARPSIAVLPFENRSDAHQDAYFVDGIHDDILTQLSKVSALKVISRTSVEQFRDTRLPTKTIAEQLGVKSILEGGVQRAGNRVRINVQLIDAGTDAHLWAESYDRELTAANIFAIQSEVAAAIAGALKAALTPDERARTNAVPTQDLAAWESYQLGRQRQAKRSSEAVAEARVFFEKAIEQDPRFALAYVGLAEALLLQTQYGGVSKQEAYAGADRAVASALAIDPGLGEAWTSAASIAEGREQFDRADEMFRRAIGLNPNYATGRQWYGEFLNTHGRHEEAIAEMRAAVALDPLSAIVNTSLAIMLDSAGRFEDAEASFRRAIEIDPSFAPAYGFLGWLWINSYGRLADGLPLLEKASQLDPGRPDYSTLRFLGYLDIGDEARAERTAIETRKHWPKEPYSNIVPCSVLMLRGERDAAMNCLRVPLALDPRNQLALAFLASLYLEQGDFRTPLGMYKKAYPELFDTARPTVDAYTVWFAIEAVPLLLRNGESEQAKVLLERSTSTIRHMPRMGLGGYGIADASIHALRGETAQGLAALREAEKAGWRGPNWRFYRDLDPALASIRNEPEFKAVFADIERDMARQRAELAARPKDAPLNLGPLRK